MQFRIRDFQMERCILNATLPRSSDHFDPRINIIDGSSVDVWMLDGNTELLPSISWGTAPVRRQHFATFKFGDDGATTSKEFRCPSGSFSTFEFTCMRNQKECLVDFWQNKSKPQTGSSSVPCPET